MEVDYAAIRNAALVLAAQCHGASRRGGWWTDLNTGEPLKRNIPIPNAPQDVPEPAGVGFVMLGLAFMTIWRKWKW